MKKKICSILFALVLALSFSLIPALPAMAAQAPVDLGSAGNFVILAKSGITTTGTTSIVGDIGVSPIVATAITGFGLILDASGQFSTSDPSSLVTGKVYAADYAVPTPANMTTAVSDMETAYTDAAGRTLPDFTELGAGNIGGLTLVPGLYKWSSGVTIPTDVTLSGGPDDVWIFQIAGTLDISSATSVILSGGAQAKNIFWAVAGAVTLGTTSEFKGNILCQTAIAMNTGATLNGRALAQTAVTLDANAIVKPTPGAAADTTPPTVSSTIPANAATGVAAINSAITATFSEALDPLTVTTATVTLNQGATPVAGTVTYAGVTATFTPSSSLAYSTAYTATITTGAKDLAGNALASNFVWSFTTGVAPDTTPPTVSSTIPANAATGVAINSAITATFSEAMDPLTVTTATFTLNQGATPVAGTVTYAGVTATFTPSSSLAYSTTYTATITTGAKDLAGNAVAINKAWTFTTGAQIAQSPVDLGSAGSFVILTKSGISTTGTTSIVGDIGVSPIVATAITGFGLIMDSSNEFSTSDPSSLVTGKVYAADYAVPTPAKMTTAVSDMETAYTDAAGRTLPDATELGAGDIGGLTLAPGLYKWSSGVTIPTDVTLSGGPDDVWIFQIAQTLTVGNGAVVTLSGGAQAKNIFWQVAGQTTLGTTSEFKGNILCQTAIVLNTGATLDGRALAQTAVTLIANAITVPTP